MSENAGQGSGGTGAGEGGGGAPDAPGPVPYARFKGVNDALGAAKADAQAARESEASLKKQLADLQAQHTTATSGWEEERTLLRAGITDEDGIATARTLFSRLAEKPKGGMAEWLDGHRAAPDAAPVPLRPYLGGMAQPQPAAPVRPRENTATTGRLPSNSADISHEQYIRERDAAKAQGKLAEFVKGDVHQRYMNRR